jgi:hypothetical protein
MDSEHVNEALVYGLDNADPLQELDLGDESNLVSNFRPLDVRHWTNSQAIMLKDAKIEKDTEKAEIAKLREELSKALELNRTITVSYRDLLQRNIERTPQKSETKRKLCSLLQEELEEKNIYCMNVTSKLNNYKKKYQALKLRFDRLRPRTTEVPGTTLNTSNFSYLKKKTKF